MSELSKRKIVVKFGGSSLADHERLLKAVMAVVNGSKKGHQNRRGRICHGQNHRRIDDHS
jgi:hypothetical protein